MVSPAALRVSERDCALTLSLIGFSFVFPFLPLYIQTRGVHGRAVPLWSGVLSFGLSIAMALVAPVWGTLADRYGRKPMVVRAMAGGVLTTGLLIVAPNVWVVLLLRILQGILAGSIVSTTEDRKAAPLTPVACHLMPERGARASWGASCAACASQATGGREATETAGGAD